MWYLETLLKYGADPNLEMVDAIDYRSLPMVKLLVDAGADPKHMDEFGNTYLYTAACSNSYDIAYYFLEKGVDPKVNAKGLDLFLSFVNDNLPYLPPPDDCRPKVIDWLKQHNEWKDKEDMWREEHGLSPKK
jgi:ankyrin repeat protein